MRILILGPYPIVKPHHGGALRASAVVRAYRDAGHEVVYSGLYDPKTVAPGDRTTTDHPLTIEVVHETGRLALPPAIGMWRALASEEGSFQSYAALTRAFKPDVIQFEEPSMWPVVRRLVAEGVCPRARIVHSSYNVETVYRRELMELQDSVVDDSVLLIEEEEREIAVRCDAIFTVSDADRDAFLAFGAKDVTVARNGGVKLSPTQEAVDAVRAYVGNEPYALFVSSAHLPNARALCESMADDKASALRTGRFLVAGSVGRLIEAMPEYLSVPALSRHTTLLGFVQQELLEALYAQAHVVVLPKVYGGGSNLKTAEALLSGRPIVGNDGAFIGFEPYCDLSNVHIENNPRAFWAHVAELLQRPALKASRLGKRGELEWSQCLIPMVKRTEALVAERGVKRKTVKPDHVA